MLEEARRASTGPGLWTKSCPSSGPWCESESSSRAGAGTGHSPFTITRVLFLLPAVPAGAASSIDHRGSAWQLGAFLGHKPPLPSAPTSPSSRRPRRPPPQSYSQLDRSQLCFRALGPWCQKPRRKRALAKSGQVQCGCPGELPGHLQALAVRGAAERARTGSGQQNLANLTSSHGGHSPRPAPVLLKAPLLQERSCSKGFIPV